MTDNTVPYPGWKNAMDKIVTRIEDEGYGSLFTHEELKIWMDIQDPTTMEEYKKKQFEYLQAVDSLRDELLSYHLMYLNNVRGQGYQVLKPNEQVSIAADKHIDKSRRELNKAAQSLINVNTSLLNLESEQLRLQKLQRIAGLKAAHQKKALPVEDNGSKLLGDAKQNPSP